MKYSKKLMEKFGSVVHQSKLEYNFIQKIIYWCIDWNYRKSVNLNHWFSAQLVNPNLNLQKLAKSLKKSNSDETVMAILKWVRTNVKYVSDMEQWNIQEYWETPLKVYNTRLCDCEGGSCLIVFLSRLCGVPPEQIFIACGDVRVGTNGTAGHAYVTYSSDEDGVERILDWCYYYDSKKIRNRIPYIEDKRYIKEWFRFNDTYSLKKR